MPLDSFPKLYLYPPPLQVNNAGSCSWFSSAFKGNISSSLVLFIALCSSMQLLTKDPFGKLSS